MRTAFATIKASLRKVLKQVLCKHEYEHVTDNSGWLFCPKCDTIGYCEATEIAQKQGGKN